MQNQRKVEEIIGMASGRGMTPEQMVRRICKERGINVDEFIKNLNNG